MWNIFAACRMSWDIVNARYPLKQLDDV